MSETKLAQMVLTSHSNDLGLILDEECRELVEEGHDGDRLTFSQCMLLKGVVLGSGLDAAVDPEEREMMKDAGLKDSFIMELAGKDGKKPLHYRARWLNAYFLRQQDLSDMPAKSSLHEIFQIGAKTEKTIPALRKALEFGDEKSRVQALEILGKIGHPAREAIPAVADILRNEKEEDYVRTLAAWALGLFGVKKIAVPALVSVLGDDNQNIRIEAIKAIVRLDAREVITDLIKISQDEDLTIREEVSKAFDILEANAKKKGAAVLKVDTNMIVNTLILLMEENPEDGYYVRALGRMGPEAKKAVPSLITRLKETDDGQMKEWVSEALGWIATRQVFNSLKEEDVDSAKTVDVLVACLENDDPAVRRVAVLLLGKTESKKAAAALIAVLGDEDARVRELAVKAIKRMELTSKAAIGGLSKILADGTEETSVRKLAAQALGKIGSSALKGLTGVLDDPNAKIRLLVLEVILLMGPEAQAAFKRISKVLGSEMEGVDGKRKAAEILAGLDPKRAVDPLSKALLNKSEVIEVKMMAADLLAGIDSGKAEASLTKSFLNASEERVLRITLGNIFGEKKTDKAIGTLSRVLLRESDEIEIRAVVAEILGDTESKRAVGPLLKTYNKAKDASLRLACVRSLGKLGEKAKAAFKPIADSRVELAGNLLAAAEEVLVKIDAGRVKQLAEADAKVKAEVEAEKEAAKDPFVEFVAKLEHGRAKVRLKAARELGEMGSAARSAEEKLAEVAQRDSNPRVRKAAAAALGKIMTAGVLEKLAAASTDEGVALIRGLGKSSSSNAVELLASILGDEARSKEFRIAAAETLAVIGSGAAAKVLIKYLGDKSEDVRTSVAQALLGLGSETEVVIPELVKKLTNGDDFARSGAIYILARMEGHADSIVPKLVEMLTLDDVKKVRTVIYILGKMGPAAVSASSALMFLATESKSEAVSKGAESALEQIKPESILSRHIKALKEGDEDESYEAAQALVAMGEKARPAVPEVVEAFRSGREESRSAATYVLLRLGEATRDAIPGLIKVLKEGDEIEKRTAIHILGSMGPAAEKAVPHLKRIAEKGSEALKAGAEKALKQIEGE